MRRPHRTPWIAQVSLISNGFAAGVYDTENGPEIEVGTRAAIVFDRPGRSAMGGLDFPPRRGPPGTMKGRDHATHNSIRGRPGRSGGRRASLGWELNGPGEVWGYPGYYAPAYRGYGGWTRNYYRGYGGYAYHHRHHHRGWRRW